MSRKQLKDEIVKLKKAIIALQRVGWQDRELIDTIDVYNYELEKDQEETAKELAKYKTESKLYEMRDRDCKNVPSWIISFFAWLKRE